VAPTPVQIGAKSLILWSGREDSNLRPLPPENGSPRFIRAFLPISLRKSVHVVGSVRVQFPAKVHIRTLGNCPANRPGRRYERQAGPAQSDRSAP